MNSIRRFKQWIRLAMCLGLLLGLIVNPAPAMAQIETGEAHIVRPGDTLMSIAARHGVRASALAAANGLTLISWVYVGQRLTIPGQPSNHPPTAPGGAYTVQRGDTLFSIARRHGTTVAALRAANHLGSNLIYVGQELTIPNGDDTVEPTPAPPSPPSQTRSGKWIDVNLSTQTVTAYEGQTPVYTALASTGTQWTPTVVGAYEIYVKYPSTTMSGPGYYLPNVPYTMYFYKGYGLHGTYWHSNFGAPMSHGCVNLATPNAEWFYNWAPIGTPVVSHY